MPTVLARATKPFRSRKKKGPRTRRGPSLGRKRHRDVTVWTMADGDRPYRTAQYDCRRRTWQTKILSPCNYLFLRGMGRYQIIGLQLVFAMQYAERYSLYRSGPPRLTQQGEDLLAGVRPLRPVGARAGADCRAGSWRGRAPPGRLGRSGALAGARGGRSRSPRAQRRGPGRTYSRRRPPG